MHLFVRKVKSNDYTNGLEKGQKSASFTEHSTQERELIPLTIFSQIPHAAGQLNPCTTTTETAPSSPQATTNEVRATRAHTCAPQEKPPQ